MMAVQDRPSRRARIAVAAGIGILATVAAHAHLTLFENVLGFDFTWPWRAARILLTGSNPYQVIRPAGVFPFDAYFKYPLPAALVALPFARLSGAGAAAAFGGISAGLLTYGLTEQSWGRLFILMSPPFVDVLFSGQWSTLLMAGALVPAVSWVAVCKPTVGLAVFAYRPNRWALLGGAILLAVSFVVLPSWLSDWLDILRRDDLARWYMAPVALIGGPVLLLALLRWRRPEARYLLLISVTPHVLWFYTAFLVMLIAQTRREAQIMSLLSVAAWFGCSWWLAGRTFNAVGASFAGYWLLGFMFVPALVMVLHRPNEGTVPAWLERRVSSLPGWLRGTPAATPISD